MGYMFSVFSMWKTMNILILWDVPIVPMGVAKHWRISVRNFGKGYKLTASLMSMLNITRNRYYGGPYLQLKSNRFDCCLLKLHSIGLRIQGVS